MDVIDQAGYDRILACIRGEMDSGRVVYLHCWGGKGRTTTVVGCLLIDGGLDYDAAIARIAELRAGTRKAVDRCPSRRRSPDYFGSAQLCAASRNRIDAHGSPAHDELVASA